MGSTLSPGNTRDMSRRLSPTSRLSRTKGINSTDPKYLKMLNSPPTEHGNTVPIGFLAETARLFTVLEADRDAAEKASDINITSMLSCTDSVWSDLQDALKRLEHEAENIRFESTRFGNCYATADKLYKASEDINNKRTKIPKQYQGELEMEYVERARRELSSDGTTKAVAAQMEECQRTRNVMDEQLRTMAEDLKANEALQDAVRLDMDTKQRNISADRSALTLRKGEVKFKDQTKPNSDLDHENWLDNHMENLQRVKRCVDTSTEHRSRAIALRGFHQQAEVDAAEHVVAVMRQKQSERRRQLMFLSTKMQRLEINDDKLTKLYNVVPTQFNDLTATLNKAQGRLRERNARPSGEQKSDNAEEFLVAEIENNEEMLRELLHQKEQLEAALAKSKADLAETSKALEEAEVARDINAACMKSEYFGSQLPEIHILTSPWVWAVNYEFDCPKERLK